ncbi:hypothetical protein IV203_035262 [Nitzschia inconspicua]|uniref:Uncharacterized protein n=1 Tax=Nitzschia inconspicua TaxID=303405 RepID=A0A9K3PUM7_9STRA|nr:hypothetical protein IV203_035262 [Nitzschia inconspicua]
MKRRSILVALLTTAGILSSLFSIQFHHHVVVVDTRQLTSSNQGWEPSNKWHTYNTTFTAQLSSTTSSSNASLCFPYNSQEWLMGKRLGNANIGNESAPMNTDEFIQNFILNTENLFILPHGIGSKRLLEQTICHKESNFLSFDTISNEVPVQQLALRLLYMAIHYHQHHPAMGEAVHRRRINLSCQEDLQHYQLGSFDFECRNAKFLVVPMKHRGLGAVMRNDAATALMAGISTNRVVLFINASPVGPSYIQAPWSWSSCPRQDKQCFFLPDSPCILTIDELQNATALSKGERRQLFKTGQIPSKKSEARVVIMDMYTRPQRTPPTFREQIVGIIQNNLLQPLVEQTPNDQDPRILRLFQALDYIQHDDESLEVQNKSVFGYFGRKSTAHHAMILYAMRPNHLYAQRLQQLMQLAFADYNRDDHLMLGMPIRASDKCGLESECPSFDLYMNLMQTVWDKHSRSVEGTSTMGSSKRKVSIIFTSESAVVHQEQKDYQANYNLSFPLVENENKASHHVPFDFITNSYDLVQDSGDPTKLNDGEISSKEEILLSTIASLQMQLNSDYVVGNCCSSHHILLVDLLQEGCGNRNNDDVSQCMQDHEDRTFRLCCAWSKTPACLEKRENRKDM